MGLTAVADFDPVTLFTGGNYDSNGAVILGVTKGIFYYDRLDFFGADVQAGTGFGEWIRWDPLLLSNVGGVFDDGAAPGTISPAGNAGHIAVGEWDRSLNTQSIYQFAQTSGTNAEFKEIQPLALNVVVDADPFPALGQVSSRILISTDIGFYDQGSTSSWVFFETWGFAFNPHCRVRHTDNIQYAGVPALINLATGAATIITAQNTAYGTETHQFSEPSLFNSSVDFEYAQFIPDQSSLPAAPRGLMMLFSEGADVPGDATRSRFWVKTFDWNPLNVDATPSRVHLRNRLLSAVDFLKATGGSLGGIFETGSPIARRMFFHPRSNRLFFATGSGPSGAQLDPGECKIVIISTSPAVASLTDPSMVTEPKTGSTCTFITEAYGSLLEQIGGIDVEFALTRVSTVDEILTIVPATPGQTVEVANSPIDPVDPNLSPVIVSKDGTPLTETTHYTLSRATGEITFVGPEPVDGSIYTATYRHFSTQASPPHGQLLNASATTDLDGAASARIKYDEENPVQDRWDRLDATQV